MNIKRIFAYVFLSTIFIFSGCDLSHKHYYNDYGVCNCGDDISQTLTYNSNKEYVSELQSVVVGETYYYKFVAHGESRCEFVIDNEEIEFERIEVRLSGRLPEVATRKDYNSKIYIYNKDINNDKTYNLKITYKNSGDMKLIVRELT